MASFSNMASSLMENLTKADKATWGPTDLPEKFKDMPYQPFSKSDRIGRIADWTGLTYSDGRLAKKYTTHFGSAQPYTYFVEEEDASYQLVDAGKGPNAKNKTRLGRMGGGAQSRGNWRGGRGGGRGGGPGGHQAQHQQLVLTKGAKLTRQQANQSRTKYPRHETRRRYDNKMNNMKKRDASVYIQPTWNILEEMDFPRLTKLSLPNVSDPQDVYVCGAVEYYDKSYDRVNCKQGRLLQRVNRVFHKVTTSDDPIIRRLSKTEGNVFATDLIVATLMCSPRSVFSWDILVHRVGDKLFFDKRKDSDFDLLTVHETATEMPFSDDPANSVNSPRHLALEATYINHNFSQQVLKMGEEKYEFEHPNPFVEPEDEDTKNSTEIGSVAYRYRKWKLGDDVTLVVRCEHDAAVNMGPDNKSIPQFMNIKAFNEWDSRTTSNIDWRQKLDVQRGAVLASELKNNSNKLGKWTIQALLSGSDYLKFGYVSRVHAKDSSKHIILGTQTFRPREFADQINLNMDNAWGILRCIIDTCMKLPEGRYLLLKDPNKQSLVLYDVPNKAFCSDDEDDDEDDDDEEDSSNNTLAKPGKGPVVEGSKTGTEPTDSNQPARDTPVGTTDSKPADSTAPTISAGESKVSA